MDAGVFELKIQLFWWENHANFNVVWKFDWKFAVKLSYPPESLQWKFQSNFHTPLKVCSESLNQNFQSNFSYNNKQNIGLKVSVETLNFHCKLSIKLSYPLKVWLQSFN